MSSDDVYSFDCREGASVEGLWSTIKEKMTVRLSGQKGEFD